MFRFVKHLRDRGSDAARAQGDGRHMVDTTSKQNATARIEPNVESDTDWGTKIIHAEPTIAAPAMK
jgi:hypothetical protein